MSRDIGRTDFRIKLKCGGCNQLLEVDSDASKMEFHSSTNAESVVTIVPCRICTANSEKPLRLIQEAMRLIEKSNTVE